ncbi:MAG TPA: [Fe-Fe] hydrogenase large subunit C-terminal domain-containing protein [Candidatus Fimivivens sp.]|nr:[Fe-Fe] hydrogenase large subunit C-terminal domain-containing protein [Candidatus Fimivivens sp.]
MDIVTFSINGREVSVEKGTTILEAAKRNGIAIPTLCNHPDLPPSGTCGMCVVSVAGRDGFVRACATAAEAGMEITTESLDLIGERKKNLETILGRHLLECDDCVFLQKCHLLELVREFQAKPVAKRREEDRILQSGAVVFDQTKCIGCGNCTLVCPTGFLEMREDGKMKLTDDRTKECINCAQCVTHCPVGAIEGVGEFEELEKLFEDGSKVMVAQFAPSIRTSIGEEFGYQPGEIVTDRLAAALRKAGFHYVFDTAFGADFTTTEEAGELLERLESGKNLPAMTSCCPSWVRFVEFFYPEFLPNLATSRSPQIMLGGIIKKMLPERIGRAVEDIVVVSIMPCVSKKYEVRRKELKVDGLYPVDRVLTTRELARLLKKKGIDLGRVDPEPADDPLGDPSGSGVIYGSSGGVFESALRAAYFRATGENIPDDAVREIRGHDGIKRKELDIDGRTVKLVVVSGLHNARTILEELKTDPHAYDAVEVMTCPGGCVGGGGQPMPASKETVWKRAQALYQIDQDKTMRRAHENKAVADIYRDHLSDEETRKKILHTTYAKKRRKVIRTLTNSKEPYEL